MAVIVCCRIFAILPRLVCGLSELAASYWLNQLSTRKHQLFVLFFGNHALRLIQTSTEFMGFLQSLVDAASLSNHPLDRVALSTDLKSSVAVWHESQGLHRAYKQLHYRDLSWFKSMQSVYRLYRTHTTPAASWCCMHTWNIPAQLG